MLNSLVFRLLCLLIIIIIILPHLWASPACQRYIFHLPRSEKKKKKPANIQSRVYLGPTSLFI